jgi:peptidyl-prolyl cis-trans isomerase SurA
MIPPLRALALAPMLLLGTTLSSGAATPEAPAPTATVAIVAIVNGDVISRTDVDNRRRLFALSTGMGGAPEVLDRLTPQVIRMLIDERLRLQEIQHRKIVVTDKEIADAIGEVESRNGLPAGGLRQRLAADGVAFRTLVDQVRVQLGWTRVLRQELGTQTQVTDADVAEQEKLFQAQIGQPEYRVGEIFIPVTDPAQAENAQRFADTVIQQLRAGAPFAMVAAQFSQSQTALQGGDLGWETANQFDPAVLKVLDVMPPGAVSNPLRVPGGIDIVTLRAKRETGHDEATMLKVRQAFYKFTQPLDPQNPTDQQRQALEQAKKLAGTAKDCDAMDQANAALGNPKPSDPGEIRLETISVPALRQVLGGLAVGKTSQPLIAEDGVAVVMVCSREVRNVGIPSKEELTAKILNDRVELASRQLMRDLQRRAVIDQRS